LDVTVEDPDLTEVIIFVSGIQRAKIYPVRIAAFNVIGLGPYSEPFHLELDAVHYDENELAVENSTRYTWLIALFGSLIFMLILVMSVLVYYRKRNMYHRKTMASHQVLKGSFLNDGYMYRVCLRLGQKSEMIIFESVLTTFEGSIFFEAAGAVLKIGLTTNSKFNQVKLVQILDTHSRFSMFEN
jgi:hypothetical protein